MSRWLLCALLPLLSCHEQPRPEMPHIVTKIQRATPERPLVIDLPGHLRGQLSQAMSKDGAALVRYDGITPTLVSRCTARTSRYSYRKHDPQPTYQLLRTESDLATTLPLYFLSLKGHLQESRGLELELTAIGTYESSSLFVTRQELEGVAEACAEATHFVYLAHVGAYRISRLSASSQSIGVTGAGAGVGLARKTLDEFSDASGNPQKCGDEGTAGPPTGCSTPIALELVKLVSESPVLRIVPSPPTAPQVTVGPVASSVSVSCNGCAEKTTSSTAWNEQESVSVDWKKPRDENWADARSDATAKSIFEVGNPTSAFGAEAKILFHAGWGGTTGNYRFARAEANVSGAATFTITAPRSFCLLVTSRQRHMQSEPASPGSTNFTRDTRNLGTGSGLTLTDPGGKVYSLDTDARIPLDEPGPWALRVEVKLRFQSDWRENSGQIAVRDLMRYSFVKRVAEGCILPTNP